MVVLVVSCRLQEADDTKRAILNSDTVTERDFEIPGYTITQHNFVFLREEEPALCELQATKEFALIRRLNPHDGEKPGG